MEPDPAQHSTPQKRRPENPSLVIVWFTFSLDGPSLLTSIEAARIWAPDARLVVAEDAAAPLGDDVAARVQAQGAWLVRTGYPRAGKLLGPENLAGQFAVMAGAVDDAMCQAEWVIKIDSDTLLNAPPGTWLSKASADHMAVCAEQPGWWFQGPCYALRAALPRALRAAVAEGALDALPSRAALDAAGWPEDVATGHLITHLCGPESILALPGWSRTLFSGPQIAHYQYAEAPDFRAYRGYRLVSFGARAQLPPQMPEAAKRLRSAETAARYLASGPF